MTNTSIKSVAMLFPTGRLIKGSLYKPSTKDFNGDPLVYRSGEKAGQSYVNYYIGVAIPKTAGVTHWSQEVSPNARIGAWGKKILDAGLVFWGDLASKKKDFKWKVLDGDSTDYDGSNPPKRICDKPNHKGHWIISMDSSMAPKIVNSNGSAYILEPDAVKTGYYIQVNAIVKSNNSEKTNQGIKIYHNMVSLQAIGEIINEVDPSTVGFGDDSVPTAPFEQVVPSPTVTAAPPPPIVPNHQFVQQAGSAPRMLKNGATYQSYIDAGWNDAQLSEAGFL